MFGRS
jgi:hypothetical protein